MDIIQLPHKKLTELWNFYLKWFKIGFTCRITIQQSFNREKVNSYLNFWIIRNEKDFVMIEKGSSLPGKIRPKTKEEVEFICGGR